MHLGKKNDYGKSGSGISFNISARWVTLVVKNLISAQNGPGSESESEEAMETGQRIFAWIQLHWVKIKRTPHVASTIEIYR